MEQETSTPGRGSEESAAWFRAKLKELGIGQSALARRMIAAEDDRQFSTILRSISRMATGDARVSGEMRALLCVLGAMKTALREVEMLEGGEMTAHADDGAGQVDVTRAALDHARVRLSWIKQGLGEWIGDPNVARTEAGA